MGFHSATDPDGDQPAQQPVHEGRPPPFVKKPAYSLDESIPDPIRERGEDLELVRQFESLPHHPIHLLDQVLHFPPIAGLFDLVRTVWLRRKNPFDRPVWRQVWGRHPFLLLTLAILVVSAVCAVINLMLVPLSNLYLFVLPSSISEGRGFLSRHVGWLFPGFLADPALWLAVVFAWKLRSLSGGQSIDPELATVSYRRPFVFRAVAVQLCLAAFLLVFLGRLFIDVSRLFVPAIGITFMPAGSSISRYALFFTGLPLEWHATLPFVLYVVFHRLCVFTWNLLYLGLYLLAILRARDLKRLAVGILAVTYGLMIYGEIVYTVAKPVIDWLGSRMNFEPSRLLAHYGILSIIYLLTIGALWRIIYSRFCKLGNSASGADTAK